MAVGSARLPRRRAAEARVSQSESWVAWRRRGAASAAERIRVASIASRRTVGSESRRALPRVRRGEGLGGGSRAKARMARERMAGEGSRRGRR